MNKVILVKCESKPHLKNTKYGPRNNDPINLSVIERVSKGRERYYPDNQGIPVIQFFRDGKLIYQWMFERDEENLRDITFENLLASKAECICGEINARHCQVHNEAEQKENEG